MRKFEPFLGAHTARPVNAAVVIYHVSVPNLGNTFDAALGDYCITPVSGAQPVRTTEK